jgi:hypothetical protein
VTPNKAAVSSDNDLERFGSVLTRSASLRLPPEYAHHDEAKRNRTTSRPPRQPGQEEICQAGEEKMCMPTTQGLLLIKACIFEHNTVQCNLNGFLQEHFLSPY